MVHVSNIMWRIKNRPSNFVSCSDKCPSLVGSCDMHILLRTSSDILILNFRLRFEGLFWERCILKGRIAFEGDWRLQCWTLFPSPNGYMLWFFSFSLLIWGKFHRIPLNWAVILLKSWASTCYFSISMGSFVTSRCFSQFIESSFLKFMSVVVHWQPFESLTNDVHLGSHVTKALWMVGVWSWAYHIQAFHS